MKFSGNVLQVNMHRLVESDFSRDVTDSDSPAKLDSEARVVARPRPIGDGG